MQDGKKMKNKSGPSLYYASDKNIFDALTRNRVNSETMQDLFLKRNIIVSKKTDRESLAEYFSRLPHDLNDHRSIALCLDTVARKERLTSMEFSLPTTQGQLAKAIGVIKQGMENSGDVVQISRDVDRVRINVKYSLIDYRKSEFSQVQARDGVIEIINIDGGFNIRSTQNDFINAVREDLILEIEKEVSNKGTRHLISLFDKTDPTQRSAFFYELMQSLPGYTVKDVNEVYVYKARPDADSSEDDSSDDGGTHVERVFLRGNGVTRSVQLRRLLSDDNYYIVRVGWIAVEKGGHGQRYEIEARFEDAKNCTGFSFLLRGVYAADPFKGYEISAKRRSATSGEIDEVSKAIEDHAKKLVNSLKDK